MTEGAERAEQAEQEWSGPWADDARQLFTLLQQTAERVLGPEPQQHDPTSHASAAECRYCPVCRGLAMVRSNGPELLDRVAEFAAGLAATLRATGPPPEQENEDDEDLVDVAQPPVVPRIVPIDID